MYSKSFKFKQFAIAQDRCAMKIGTDGVLLGAWASIKQKPNSILDIGAGTGVIALMLAQRSNAQTIDALELDDNAYEQATENFENSDWGDRLFCYHAHLYEFAVEIDEEYDLILCNPPFYGEVLNEDSKRLLRSRSQSDGASQEAREKARFEESMPFELLVGAVAKLLSAAGRFNVIIPHHREEDFIVLCSRADLYPTRITRVKGTPTSEVKRSLMEFRFGEFDALRQAQGDSDEEFCSRNNPDNYWDGTNFRKSEPKIDELIIEKSRHNYTDDYIALVKDFYLKM